MDEFLSLVEFLVAISVGVAAISNYLIINKLWKRRDKKDVAESISIGAAFLGLATGVPFFIQFVMIDHSTWPAVKAAIGIVTGTVFVLIGSGLWVRENRGVGFGRLVIRALNLERRESSYLLKALVQPKGADRILEVLHRLAMIDRDLDEREIELIRDFAARWRLPPPDLEAGAVDNGSTLVSVRDAMVAYLDLRPPADQVSELVDLFRMFVGIDGEVSTAEETVLSEIEGLAAAHIHGEGAPRPLHEVVLVPQDAEQFEAVKSIIPRAEMKRARGGRVFSAGTFYSAAYAEEVCQKYIALGLFTTHVEQEEAVIDAHAA